MTVPRYGAECPFCHQVRHVADAEEALDAIIAHLQSATTPEFCAAWPDLHWRRLNARRRRRAKLRRFDLWDSDHDLGYCPHYRGVGICYQLGVCGNPDVMEPLCETCEPEGGWPSTCYINLGELDYQPVTLQRSATP